MKIEKFPIEIGMTVYLEPIGDNRRLHPKGAAIPGKISRINEKHFRVKFKHPIEGWGYKTAKFDKDTFECWDGYEEAGYSIYLTQEDYERALTRRAKLWAIIGGTNRYRDELPDDVVSAMYEPLANWMSQRNA